MINEARVRRIKGIIYTVLAFLFILPIILVFVVFFHTRDLRVEIKDLNRTLEEQQTVIAQLEAAKAGGKKIVRSSGEGDGDERLYQPDEDGASEADISDADTQNRAADPGAEADGQSSGSTPSGATLDTGNLTVQNESDVDPDPNSGSGDTQTGDSGSDRTVSDDSIPAPSIGEIPDRSSDMPNTGIN